MAWKNRKRQRPSNNSSNTKSSKETIAENESNIITSICKLKELIRGDTRRLRIVHPYPYTFETFAKARWVDRSLLDVFHEEFGSYPKLYYEAAIQEGRITVNQQRTATHYLIQGGDVIRHTVHRHEPAVAVAVADNDNDDDHQLLKVVFESQDILVVDKPSTMPIHPCGAYNFNSLFSILENSSSRKKLYTVHRLDRLTSGVTIIAKEPHVAKRLGKCITDRTSCEKIYLARVKGKFPLHYQNAKTRFLNCETNGVPCHFGETILPTNCSENLIITENYNINAAHGFWITDAANNPKDNVTLEQLSQLSNTVDDILAGANQFYWLHLACPCRIAQPKIGICEAGDFTKDGSKPAQTSFAFIAYDAQTDSSIVLAKPLTGRTHQIRLHLQYLGHPIANDPNYGGDIFFHNELGEEACKMATEKIQQTEQSKKDTTTTTTTATSIVAVQPTNLPYEVSSTADTPATEEEIVQHVSNQKRDTKESLLDYIRRTCVWCARGGGDTTERTVLEFLVRSQGIWLHALQYTIDGVTYRTDPPKWSQLH